MPLYEYRCLSCGCVTTTLRSAAESAAAASCQHCGAEARRIVSAPSVHRSRASKVARLDPRYHKMVDAALRGTPNADPDRHLRRTRPARDD